MTERERYKKHISTDEEYKALRERAIEFTAKKGLGGRMNDTKWLELQKAVIETLPFPVPFVVKCLGEEMEPVLDGDVTWLGDWSNYYDEGMPPLVTIEYIKVRPRVAKYRGRLIDPDIMDCTERFTAILQDLNIDYIEQEGTFTIYGYR